MTREEAIEILKPILFFDEKKQKALNMAIEALEKPKIDTQLAKFNLLMAIMLWIKRRTNEQIR